jgi:hypothetical protein
VDGDHAVGQRGQELVGAVSCCRNSSSERLSA